MGENDGRSWLSSLAICMEEMDTYYIILYDTELKNCYFLLGVIEMVAFSMVKPIPWSLGLTIPEKKLGEYQAPAPMVDSPSILLDFYSVG